jgi:hypothetical protein
MLLRTVVGMQPTLSTAHLDRLAHRIAQDGMTAHEAAVELVVRQAAAFGIAPTPVGILADRTAPPVARERAFARVVAALERERASSFVVA